MATDKISYTSNTIVISLSGLTSNATISQSSQQIDNSTNLYVDAMVSITFVTGGGALANDKAVYVYLYGSGDGTNFESEGTIPTANASITLNSPTVFRLARVIPAALGTQTYCAAFSVAGAYGGVMPQKWGIIVNNFTGQNFGTTATVTCIANYNGIYYTSA